MFNIEKHQRTKESESPLRPVKRAEIRKTDNGKCWQNVEEQKLSCTAVGTQMGTVSLHRNWAVSSLLNTGDTCRVAIHQRRTLDAGWSHSDIMEMRCELWMKSLLLEKRVQNNSRGPHPGS